MNQNNSIWAPFEMTGWDCGFLMVYKSFFSLFQDIDDDFLLYTYCSWSYHRKLIKMTRIFFDVTSSEVQGCSPPIIQFPHPRLQNTIITWIHLLQHEELFPWYLEAFWIFHISSQITLWHLSTSAFFHSSWFRWLFYNSIMLFKKIKTCLCFYG